MSIGYTLRIREPEAKRAEISLEADARGEATLDVRLPVLTPGSYLNPAAACAFFVGRESEPCTVRTELLEGWQSWVALPRRDGAWHAEDYDELADSPFEMGPVSSHQAHSFTAHGVQHEIVVWGKG